MNPTSRKFSVEITKDHLVFSAGHFITIDDFCERLHGHNFRVAAEAEGILDHNGYVFDFIALRDELQKLCDGLDHRMLLPLNHPKISLQITDHEIEARFEERRWVFPKEECILLPIVQTTVELIGHWLGEQLIAKLKTDTLTSLTLRVEENFGQWATCRFDFSPTSLDQNDDE